MQVICALEVLALRVFDLAEVKGAEVVREDCLEAL